jgi:hypothetical protein
MSAPSPPPGMEPALDELRDYRAELRAALERQPAEFAAMVAAIPEAEWRRRHDRLGRPIHMIAAHVRDLEALAFLPRIVRIQEADDPVLDAYPTHHWSQADYRPDEPMDAILAAWSQTRAELVNRLQGLPEAAWSRMGFHPPSGRRTLQWWVERAYTHAADHLADIRALGG